MFFFAIIRFRASANVSQNLFLNIYLFWLLHLSQKFLFYLSSWFFLFSIASCIKFSSLQLILYLKVYVLLCYAIFEINITKIADRLTYSNTSFWLSFVLISALYIPYSKLTSSHNDQHFSKFVRGLDIGYFCIFQNFTIY